MTQSPKNSGYRGRFAPSPTGPLHFGSLVAALGSYLDARRHDGIWLLRMEDVDTPRVVAGAADAILHALEAYGFEWDGEVMYQSRRNEAYQAALERLQAQGLVYACHCSRKQLAETARRGIDGLVYSGLCRNRPPMPEPAALRLIVPAQRIVFDDAWQGRVACDLHTESGDFVLKRADGIYAYQLAVVVDDAEQGISDIVRGADLLTSTPRQIALQHYLGLPTPHYLHLPVVLDAAGDKLSKQTLAAPIDPKRPLAALLMALRFLGIGPVRPVASLDEFWAQARELWAGAGFALRGRRPVEAGAIVPEATAALSGNVE
ncbi:MAG: tRNA glutamyl-Q(34) synthetase GluQRS [Hydrogenophilaceae bacterium]|nr:tRNA glutamyl-Q(34) synthetase GluQRS [Hydrogenophilaceae bacterium]